MKVIKYEEADKISNSDVCNIQEYSFSDKDIDLGVATITGRYPESGYCKNNVCKELVHVLDGNGKIIFANEELVFKKGDSILIDKGEKYYWDTSYTVVALACTPAFTSEQHELLD